MASTTTRHTVLNERIDELLASVPPRAEDAVLLALPLADSIARRYRGRGADPDDLAQVARLGLVKAVRGYRPGSEAGFTAYAIPTIAGEIKRWFRDHEWLVRPPRSLQELQAQVVECRQRLWQTLGRPATDEEVAADLGVTAVLVRDAGLSRRAYAAAPGSGDHLAQLANGSDQYEVVLLRDSLGRVLSGLTEREALLYRLRFVEGRSQSEIGARIGVSQVQVSRLLTRLLTRLRGELEERAAS